MNIKPYDTRIRKLFQSAFYRIPRFQRPYSWDKENIEDFWADIIISGKSSHFIGSMVLYENKGSQDLFVVDGQQRLTTITIFLAALRDTLTEVGEPELAKGLQGIIERQDITAQNRYVLLTESSYPYFQEYIQKHGAPELDIKPSDEEKGLHSAYQYAIDGFKAITEEVRASTKAGVRQKDAIRKRLEASRDALLSLDLIVIQLDSEDDAYVVFETLNTRGRDLEPKDLIKNLLTKLLPAKSVDVDTTKIKWNKTIDSLSQSAANLDMSTYLHHFWLSSYDYTPQKTLFERVKKHVNKANAQAFLDAVHKDTKIYRRIFEPSNFPWKKEEEPLRSSLAALVIFKVSQPTPLVLAILRAYYAEKISLKQARETLSVVERFHFMYTAVAGQSSSGGVSKMYAAAGRELSSETDKQKQASHLQAFRAKLNSKLPDKTSFLAGFSELRYSQADSRDRPLVRYILTKIDSHLRKDAVADYSKMTIEHIAPQNPPASSTTAQLYPTLGNLILVSEGLNGNLKNKSFVEKKKLLTGAGCPLDDAISGAAAWNDKAIAARTKALADLLYAKDI